MLDRGERIPHQSHATDWLPLAVSEEFSGRVQIRSRGVRLTDESADDVDHLIRRILRWQVDCLAVRLDGNDDAPPSRKEGCEFLAEFDSRHLPRWGKGER